MFYWITFLDYFRYREGGDYIPGAKKRRRFRDLAAQDYDEAIEELEKTRSQKKSETIDENQSNSEPKKKKRRRKKGVKKQKDVTVSEVQKPTQIETSHAEQSKADNDGTKKKKKRKKQPKNSDSTKKATVDGVSSSRLASYGI